MHHLDPFHAPAIVYVGAGLLAVFFGIDALYHQGVLRGPTLSMAIHAASLDHPYLIRGFYLVAAAGLYCHFFD